DDRHILTCEVLLVDHAVDVVDGSPHRVGVALLLGLVLEGGRLRDIRLLAVVRLFGFVSLLFGAAAGKCEGRNQRDGQWREGPHAYSCGLRANTTGNRGR